MPPGVAPTETWTNDIRRRRSKLECEKVLTQAELELLDPSGACADPQKRQVLNEKLLFHDLVESRIRRHAAAWYLTDGARAPIAISRLRPVN